MPSGTRRRSDRLGFTLIELLTVIGIIVILMAILLPVLAAVRRKGFETDTAAQLSRYATVAQNYYHDFRAYPGPIPDRAVIGYNMTTNSAAQVPPTFNNPTSPNPSSPAPNPQPSCVTSSENFVLGICGGMSFSGGAYYHQALVGKGPQSLNPLNPQAFPPYIDVVKGELSDDGVGNYRSYTASNASLGYTLAIPELMDHFPTPHPIIYLRARVGAPTICDQPGVNGGSQYYSTEMTPYGYTFPTPADPANNNLVLYANATAFFQHPTINDGFTPRSKDSFILISAGADGIFGTKDDIVYSN